MKKFAAWIAVTVLLVCMLSVGVQAEGFAFVELRRDYDYDAMKLIVTWNYESFGDGDELEGVLIGGHEMPFSIESEKLVVDISALDAGIYPVEYVYIPVGGAQATVKASDMVVSGAAEITLTPTIHDNGTVTVTARNGSGAPVAGYKVSLIVGSVMVGGETDGNGNYKSIYKLQYGQTLVYEGLETMINQSITCAAVAKQTMVRQRPATTTTTTVPTTTTTGSETTGETTDTTGEGETTETTGETTEATTVGTTATTAPTSSSSVATGGMTNASVYGQGTTAVRKDQIALNVSTDVGMLELFGCEFDHFSDNARFLVSKADYEKLVGRTRNSLMLNVLMPAEQASEAQVDAALALDNAFAEFGDTRSWITMKTSFLMLDKEGKIVPVTAVPLGATYTVELPIPDSMSDHSTFAVTIQDGDGLQKPIKITAEDGVIRFGIQSMEVFTVIGLGEGGSQVGGIPTLAIILLVIGVLLLVAAGVLLWLFVFRKPAAKKEQAAPEIVPTPEVSGDDIFSGRTDLPPSDGE